MKTKKIFVTPLMEDDGNVLLVFPEGIASAGFQIVWGGSGDYSASVEYLCGLKMPETEEESNKALEKCKDYARKYLNDDEVLKIIDWIYGEVEE